MATRTIGSWGTDTGTVTAELDYDASNTITAVRVINGSQVAALLTVTQISNGRTVSHVFPANTTTEIPVPTGAAQRIQQFVNARGMFDGLDIRCVIPAP